MSRSVFLRLEWGVSIALAAIALSWGAMRELPFLLASPPTPRDFALGLAVGALLWLCIPLLRWSGAMRRVWENLLVPFARQFGVLDVIVIALLSGITEELFFRGVLLPEIGIAASSLLFGALHALNAVYAIWAACTGAAFGLLALEGKSLVAPMVAHATYNLGALLVLRRWPVPSEAPPPHAATPPPASSR